MKKSSGIVHGIANCEDCNWSSSSYKNILGISAIHARSKKHKVMVEIGTIVDFDGREEAKE